MTPALKEALHVAVAMALQLALFGVIFLPPLVIYIFQQKP